MLIGLFLVHFSLNFLFDSDTLYSGLSWLPTSFWPSHIWLASNEAQINYVERTIASSRSTTLVYTTTLRRSFSRRNWFVCGCHSLWLITEDSTGWPPWHRE